MKSSPGVLAGIVFLSLGAAAFAAEVPKRPAAEKKPPAEASPAQEETSGPQRGFKFRNLGPATNISLEGRNTASAINEMLPPRWLGDTVDGLPKLVGGGDDADGTGTTKYAAALSAARDLNKRIRELKDSVYNREIQRDTPSDSLHFHNDFQGKASRLGFLAGAYGEAPREVAREEIAAIRKRAEDYLARFNALVSGDLAAYNRATSQQGVPTLFAGDPIHIEEPAI